LSSAGAPKDILTATSLREELDIHESFTWEKFLREGIDAHFNARYRDYIDTTPNRDFTDLASVYWKQTKYVTPFDGSFTCPKGKSIIGVYSKRTFQYGILSAKTRTINVTSFIGFENGANAGNGVAAFRFDPSDKLYAILNGAFTLTNIDISTLYPTDHLTIEHVYTITILKNLAEFYIDNSLVAVGVNSPNLAFTTINGPPYFLFPSNIGVSPNLQALIEVWGFGSPTIDTVLPLSPYNFRVSDGDPLPPRVYRLYETATSNLFAGLSMASGSKTSHPFPIFGYAGKTIYFQANQPGTLGIQVLMQTDNWRTHSSPSVAADTLLKTTITEEGVLARVIFTPSAGAFPATINEAEVIMS